MTASRKRLRIVLVAPRIAANVGNIARTAEALNAELSLVRPLGFFLDSSKLKRSSVGYWDSAEPIVYNDAADFWSRFAWGPTTQVLWATKFGDQIYSEVAYSDDLVLLFGNEEEGIPQAFFQSFQPLPRPVVACRIPMAGVRCLNLATSVGVFGFEVARQWGWEIMTSNRVGYEN
jgi:tRNA (cytidine/uridine-2'-O-)-methyltransferase